MKFLLVNDDGINHINLINTKKALENFGELYVSAPLEEMSGASISLKVYRGIKYHVIDTKTISVEGTPADCAFIGLYYFGFDTIDVVVSGTNNGFNESYDHLFSGTIGGAIAGSLFQKKAIALSADFDDFDMIYEKTFKAIEYVLKNKLLDSFPMLSINYPSRAFKQGKGFKAGHINTFPNDEIFTDKDGKIKTYRNNLTKLPESDRYYSFSGYYSITCIKPSLEDYQLTNKLKKMLK